MLTTVQIRNAAKAASYFKRELSASDYYASQQGAWYGKGAASLAGR